MYIAISLLVCLVGVFIYLISDKPKITEVGRIMFWVGLFICLWQLQSSHLFGIAH